MTWCVTGVEAARDSSCPRICPQSGGGDPVCGSDDVIYRNLCELKKKSCGKGNIVSTLNIYQLNIHWFITSSRKLVKSTLNLFSVLLI